MVKDKTNTKYTWSQPPNNKIFIKTILFNFKNRVFDSNGVFLYNLFYLFYTYVPETRMFLQFYIKKYSLTVKSILRNVKERVVNKTLIG